MKHAKHILNLFNFISGNKANIETTSTSSRYFTSIEIDSISAVKPFKASLPIRLAFKFISPEHYREDSQKNKTILSSTFIPKPAISDSVKALGNTFSSHFPSDLSPTIELSARHMKTYVLFVFAENFNST